MPATTRAKRTASSPSAQSKAFRTLTSVRLHLLAHVSERVHEREYRKRFGLNLAQCRIIGIIGSHGTRSFSKVCDELALHKAHVSRLVSQLVRKGLVSRHVPEHDQRMAELALTTAGKAVNSRLYTLAVALNSECLDVLSAAQRSSFSIVLDMLTAQLQVMSERRRKAQKAAADE